MDSALKHLRDQIVAAVGPAVFNRLVESVEKTRKHGRLRYWQEQLFKEMKFLPQPMTLEEYLRIFDGAPLSELPPPPPITREFFLANANDCWYSLQRKEIRDEWFIEAWRTQPAFRENVSSEIANTVSKLGQLSAHVNCLAFMTRTFSRDDAVSFYVAIRDASMRLEYEWRQEFEKFFPQATDLPEPLSRPEDFPPSLEVERGPLLGPPFKDEDIPY